MSLSRLSTVVAAVAALAAVAPAAALADDDRHEVYGATELKVTAPLGALGLSAEPIGPARVTREGNFAFPITTSLSKAQKRGTIRHTGGIVLKAGDKKLKLRRFVIDLGAKQLTARVKGDRVPILDLAIPEGAKLAPGPVGPIPGTLTPQAAGALTATFGAPDLTGVELGQATVVYEDEHDDDDDDHDDDDHDRDDD
jgi:hypothetical protein